MLREFREFIARGNVIDLAVGIIMGAAFTSIVNSLVKDIIMPPIGMITGGVDFAGLFVTLSSGHYATLADAQKAGAPTLNYGNFINNVIDFLIVALVIFLLIKAIDSLKKKPEPAPAADPITKDCPHCFTTISIKATRCPNCTSELS